MFRTNGGLIGTRRTPTFVEASGVWSLVEQILWARTNNWSGPNPIPYLSPLFWYDFSDEASVTVSSSRITTVTDKGSIKWDLTKSTTGPLYGTGINGLKCVDWGTPGHSNYLRNTSSTSTSISEVYIVLDGNFGTGFAEYYGLITGATGGFYVTGYGFNGSPSLIDSSGFNQAFINNGATSGFGAVLPTINNPALMRLRRSDGTAVTTIQGLQFGQERTSGGRGWGGFMGEIVGFSSILGTSDRTLLQTFLATKWGLTLA